MKEDWMRMTLRVPVQLRDQVETEARRSRRSINAEIIAELENWHSAKEAAASATN